MTAPPILFPDPVPLVKALLVELLADQGVSATVSSKDPPAADPPLPYVQVGVDGRFRDSRLNGRASMRLVVWGRDTGSTVELGGLVEALLLSARSAEVRGFSPLTGPRASSDPTTGAPMAALTLTARLKPRQL